MNPHSIFSSRDVVVFLLAGIVVVGLLFAFIMYFIFSYRNKQRDFHLLQLQKDEIDAQKALTDAAMQELKETQVQLVQSEKLASLGELTAGIAHEIQNPLNFVNNFSEVSNDMINEMEEELAAGNYDNAKEVAKDLKQNLERINHHGKRADGIVKAMLQHSRTGTGEKQATDINVLCDEYLRLSYHGLRAKSRAFNAAMITDFDPAAGEIRIVSQDIGRVILNLLNNAFYAVNEKLHTNAGKGNEQYEPTVQIRTKRIDQKIRITVEDNGAGIPTKIADKIFQPFFTTKPTGQGTGLGLSLSYDIIKAAGGDLKMETKEGTGTSFIVSLPA